MKKQLYLIIVLLFFTSFLWASEVRIQIRVTISEDSEDSTEVYITGNHSKLGNWNPSFIQMDKIGDCLFEKALDVESGTLLEYKITKGSWDTEALYEREETTPDNFVHIAKRDINLSHIITSWKSEARDIVAVITGEFYYYPDFHSEYLSHDRNISVRLPNNYSENQNKNFPVLYVHDGQNSFSAVTSLFGDEWGIDETADSLIQTEQMQTILIVFIDNTSARMEEYSPTEQGRAYLKFLAEELKPFIDTRYRTLIGSENTGIMGSSLGGGISLLAVLEYPEIFGKAACLSIAVLPEFREQIYESISQHTSPVYLYIDTGNELNIKGYPEFFTKLTRLISTKRLNVNGKINIAYFPDHSHMESAWAKRVHYSLKILFPAN